MSPQTALQTWINWDMITQLPPLANCTNISCAELCFEGNRSSDDANDATLVCDSYTKSTAALWDPHATSNLATCGLWWTVAMATHWNINLGVNQFTNNTDSSMNATLAAFSQVGLDLPAAGFSTPDIPALDCFADVLSYRTSGDALNLGKDPVPWCSVDVLFGYQALSTLSNSSVGDGIHSKISLCLDNICSPKTPFLNQDIGGIGIFASFMMQSSIAIVCFLTLLCLKYTPTLRDSKRARDIFDILITAVVGFHKAQCYFALAIQIAALVLTAGQASYSASPWDDYINDELCYIVATNGYIPVIFTLAYISFFGRRSWYLISLSFCSFVLSTTTLAEVTRIFWGVPVDYATDGSVLCGACGGHSTQDLIAAWCPPNTATPDVGAFKAAKGWWNWAIWAVCLFWLIHTAWKMDMSTLTLFFRRWIPGHNYPAKGEPIFKKIGSSFAGLWRKLRIVYIFFPISWATAFGYQYSGFALFFQHSEISNSWSFGQIVAITVWIPNFAEFIYLLWHGMTEGHRYGLPHHYAVVETRSTALDTSEIPLTWKDDTEMRELAGQNPQVDTPSLEHHGFDGVTSYSQLGEIDIAR
ncbi:hypothetical protein N7G274_007959 [Stereocaulon virgatum]|uniref:Uncharacterized protein n=1 Tax=Stereocaulon virgatum TaxID=373712 RepID=A0ABR4A2Z4_9LECA